MNTSRAAFLNAAGAASIGMLLDPALARAAAATEITIGVTTNESIGTAFYATDLGMFRDAGFDSKLTVLTNPAPELGAVVAGTLSIAGIPISQAALARAQGIPIKLIAPASVYLSSIPSNALITLKNSPLATAADLSGKTIATRDLANMSYIGARTWIDKNGGDSKTVKWLEASDSQHVAALQAGRVDAASIGEPAFDDALAGGNVRVLGRAFDAIAPRFLVAAYYTTETFAKENPDIIRRFAGVIAKASRWANQAANHPRSAQILAHYALAAPRPDSTRVSYGEVLQVSDIQPVLDVLRTYDFLKAPMRASDLILTT